VRCKVLNPVRRLRVRRLLFPVPHELGEQQIQRDVASNCFMQMTGSGHQDWAESLYYHIAKDALEVARDAAKLEPGNEAEWKRKKTVTTVIVFSALCLEAFINKQYFVSGSSMADSSGKLLEHWQRWVALPSRLDPANNQTFDQSAPLFTTFRQLVTFRNQRVVHFNPNKEGHTTIPDKWQPWADEMGNLPLAEKYFSCVTEMVEELHQLTNGTTQNAANSIHAEYVREVWSSMRGNFEVR
jgi:hypothetical protein